MITQKQRRVYEWIREFVNDRGAAPSYEEIRRGMGFRSLNTVSYHLKRLERAGYIRSPWGNRKRAVELAGGLRILGEVRAGAPVESYEVPEETDLPDGFFGSAEDHFALRVRGESMVDEGIMDGDVIVVRRTATARDSQVVVALVDGEATVKRFRRQGRMIELVPANPEYQPIKAEEDRVNILGTVAALFRRY